MAYVYRHRNDEADEKTVGLRKHQDDKGVDRAYVYDNFVPLCNVDGRKSIVYSVDDTKTKWIDCPGDESPKIRIIQATKNWYYIELVKKMW